MVKIENIKKNKHGFTLIELLAVIIILGILLLIAVPAISRYIEESRKSTYINSVQSIVSAISTSVNNLEYPLPSKNEAIIIPFSEVELEKGVSNTKSPFASYEEGKSYIVVTFDGIMYHYYVSTLDNAGYSIPLIDTKKLNKNSITTDSVVISSNVYALSDIQRGNVLDTYQFAMKYKSKSGNIIKVSIGDSVYEKGDVVQLKDGSKWYVLPNFDESGRNVSDSLENKTINLLSYYHMETEESKYGFQSNSKTEPFVVYESWDNSKGSYDYANDGSPKYENADIYEKSQNIINAARTKLLANGLNSIGINVDMPSVADFCGVKYTFPIDMCRLDYLASDGGIWTKNYYSSNVLAIANGVVSSTSPHYGDITADTSDYGIRIVVKNLLKSNIDKEATKKIN